MDNPWKVDSIQAFSCLKCPECSFNTKEEDLFQDHALNNHPLSHLLFDKSKKLLEISDSTAEFSTTSKRPAENIECTESETKKAKNDSDLAAETSQNTPNKEAENDKSGTEQKSIIQATNKNKNEKKDFVRGIPKNLKPDDYRIGSNLCRSEFFLNSADLRDGISERLKCVICDENGKNYDTVSDVQAHVVLDHIGENPHQIECYYCKCDTYLYEISLYGQKYECPKCLHIYPSNIGLVSHEERRKYKEHKIRQKEITRQEKEDFENCWNRHKSHFCCGCGGSFVHQKIDSSEIDSSDEDD